MEEAELISLTIIALATFVCPMLSALVPRGLVPETVLLLASGMVFGPNALGILTTGDYLTLLSDLGLGFLFLLAGYELDPKRLVSRSGRIGLVTWLISFGIAIAIVVCLPRFEENEIGWLAVAIALTTTAFGTLIPILKERGLLGTPIGNAIIDYGAWGEFAPVMAIALILSTRATWLTIVILLCFAAIAIISALVPKALAAVDSKVVRFVSDRAETNAQMTVRGVMVLLVSLVTVSALFDLDIVLGAFAAGFVLRFLYPAGDESLDRKLNGIGYGFFIPLFFIVSGMRMDPAAITEEPLMLVLFILALLGVRALPVFVSLGLNEEYAGMDARERGTVALYCTTALPLIVAVTTVATEAGAMTDQTASLLIAAGGITVLLMPLLASITLHTMDADIGEAARSIREDPRQTIAVLKRHRALERSRSRERKAQRERTRTKDRRPHRHGAPSDDGAEGNRRS